MIRAPTFTQVIQRLACVLDGVAHVSRRGDRPSDGRFRRGRPHSRALQPPLRQAPRRRQGHPTCDEPHGGARGAADACHISARARSRARRADRRGNASGVPEPARRPRAHRRGLVRRRAHRPLHARPRAVGPAVRPARNGPPAPRRGPPARTCVPLVRSSPARSLRLPAGALPVRLVPRGAAGTSERLERGRWRRPVRLVRRATERPARAHRARPEVAALPAAERLRGRRAAACRPAARERARTSHALLRAARHRPRDHRGALARRDPRAASATEPSGLVTASDVADKLTSLAKRRGFVFPSSEIYGGAGATWDYGPLGVELKNNVKRAWWRAMVQLREDMVGLDAAILMHPKVWEASGHVENFTDPLVECRNCRKRYRIDELPNGDQLMDAWRSNQIEVTSVACPNCGEKKLADPRRFNLMFKTFVGPAEDTASVAWLRPRRRRASSSTS